MILLENIGPKFGFPFEISNLAERFLVFMLTSS